MNLPFDFFSTAKFILLLLFFVCAIFRSRATVSLESNFLFLVRCIQFFADRPVANFCFGKLRIKNHSDKNGIREAIGCKRDVLLQLARVQTDAERTGKA